MTRLLVYHSLVYCTRETTCVFVTFGYQQWFYAVNKPHFISPPYESVLDNLIEVTIFYMVKFVCNSFTLWHSFYVPRVVFEYDFCELFPNLYRFYSAAPSLRCYICGK